MPLDRSPRLLVVGPTMLLVLWATSGCTQPNPAFSPEPNDAAVSRETQADLPPVSDGAGGGGMEAAAEAQVPLDGGPEDSPAALDSSAPVDRPMEEMAALEAAPEAPRDSASGAAPFERTVTLSGQTPTTLLGGGTGTPFTDRCAPGRALSGYEGYVQNYTNGSSSTYLVGVQAVCSDLRVPAGSTAVNYNTWIALTRRGGTGGGTPAHAWQRLCPQHSVIVGVINRSGGAGSVDNLQFRCAPLGVAASPPGALQTGPVEDLPSTGTNPSNSQQVTDCPPGQVAIGHEGSVGSWLDRFQLVCAVPTVPPPS